jgi:hypothetical protein
MGSESSIGDNMNKTPSLDFGTVFALIVASLFALALYGVLLVWATMALWEKGGWYILLIPALWAFAKDCISRQEYWPVLVIVRARPAEREG